MFKPKQKASSTILDHMGKVAEQLRMKRLSSKLPKPAAPGNPFASTAPEKGPSELTDDEMNELLTHGR